MLQLYTRYKRELFQYKLRNRTKSFTFKIHVFLTSFFFVTVTVVVFFLKTILVCLMLWLFTSRLTLYCQNFWWCASLILFVCFVLVLLFVKMLHSTGLRLRECVRVGRKVVPLFVVFCFCFCFSSARKGTIFDKILHLIPWQTSWRRSSIRRRLLRFRLFMFASSTSNGGYGSLI